jgi:hypothetical protein
MGASAWHDGVSTGSKISARPSGSVTLITCVRGGATQYCGNGPPLDCCGQPTPTVSASSTAMSVRLRRQPAPKSPRPTSRLSYVRVIWIGRPASGSSRSTKLTLKCPTF